MPRGRTSTFLLFLAVPSALTAGGATGAELLKLGAGARAAAMADAQTALADDAFALRWNPAGLARLSAPDAAFMHNQWFEDVRQQHAAAAFPLRGAGTFAAGVNRVAVEEYNGFDAQGARASPLTSEAL